MDDQDTFKDLDRQLQRAGERAWKEHRTQPMKPWIGMIQGVAKRVADRYRKRDEDLYEELRVLEEEVKSGLDSSLILDRIEHAKELAASIENANGEEVEA